MRSPRTAKDDQPGPTGGRHSSTGGDFVQSVAIRTPGTAPSRAGPRNPGHSGLAVAPPAVAGTAAGASRGVSEAFAEGAAAGASLTAGAGSTGVVAGGAAGTT